MNETTNVIEPIVVTFPVEHKTGKYYKTGTDENNQVYIEEISN